MATLRPFRALRPKADQVALIAAPPYDVVDRTEALALASHNPLSFLHVSKSEIDLPLDVSAESEAVYAKAKQNFGRLVESHFIEAEPALYVYRLKKPHAVTADEISSKMEASTHIQTGVFGCFCIEEYENGSIKKHELTRKQKEDDRTRHTLSLRAHTGPTYLTYRDVPEIKRALAQITLSDPLYDFASEDGVIHQLWQIKDPKLILNLVELFGAKVPTLYIADGHHRAAASCRLKKELSETSVSTPENDSEKDYFLAAAFPDSELKILAYHRLVRDISPLSQDALLAKISQSFVVTPIGSLAPTSKLHIIRMFLDQWYELTHKSNQPALEPLSALDVDLLQLGLLDPILGIKDPRTDPRIDFMGGVHGLKELEDCVKDGKAAVAFALHPTPMKDMMDTCDSNRLMPPKSTWFEPKLRDGLLIHRF